MMDTKVATRYAKSLIDLALDKGILEEIYRDMLLFNDISQQNRDFVLMLRNPIINHDKKKAILYALFQDKVHKSTLAIFDIIVRKNREAYLPAIADAFIEMYRKQKGIEKAAVTTAVPMDDTLRSTLKQQITQKVGKQIELTEAIDPSIIGGFILKIGDKQMDNSIRFKLKALAHELSDTSYTKVI